MIFLFIRDMDFFAIVYFFFEN